jgi:hypothetical protein
VNEVRPVPPFVVATVPDSEEVGRFVALARLTEVGVPRIGVTRVGLVLSTLLPEPVLVVTPVPPAVTGSVPEVRAEELVA